MKKVDFPEFDIIVAIGRDGIKPASLLSDILNVPVKALWINYRRKDNQVIRKEPALVRPMSKSLKKTLGAKKGRRTRILLVDNVSRTGKTLKKAKELLKGSSIKTFVVNGDADYSLFMFDECISWPWN
ncbi:phosphoribosyltransferase, partial [Candidatus Woesearchaeota archaeon]|nr:phosphoribosyltransferase [Candidatus Woesearchaeota archaeon]